MDNGLIDGHEIEVEAIVAELMQANQLFTSVDVSNRLKTSGPFVRNRYVAGWLRDHWYDVATSVAQPYKSAQIMVGPNLDIQTTLYLPENETEDVYTDRDQKAFPPDLSDDDEVTTEPATVATTIADAVVVTDLLAVTDVVADSTSNVPADEPVQEENEEDDVVHTIAYAPPRDCTGMAIHVGSVITYPRGRRITMVTGVVVGISTGAYGYKFQVVQLSYGGRPHKFTVNKANRLVVVDRNPFRVGTREHDQFNTLVDKHRPVNE